MQNLARATLPCRSASWGLRWIRFTHSHNSQTPESMLKSSHITVYNIRLSSLRPLLISEIGLGFVGTVGKSPAWVRTILNDRLAYLSSLAIETVRQDIVEELPHKSRKTTAVEMDIVSMIKSKLSDPRTALSDETIFGILHLLTAQIIQVRASILARRWFNQLIIMSSRVIGNCWISTYKA